MAGFLIPNSSHVHTPSLEELKMINGGMGPAVTAYRMMCESMVQMCDVVKIPAVVHEDLATSESAQRLLCGKTVNFIHRSLLLALFYAALILGSVQSSTAVFVDDACGNARHVEWCSYAAAYHDEHGEAPSTPTIDDLRTHDRWKMVSAANTPAGRKFDEFLFAQHPTGEYGQHSSRKEIR